MNCTDVQERLQEFVDGELSDAEQDPVTNHLKSCDDCTNYYKQLSEFTSTVLEALAPLRPSGDFSSHVIDRVRDSQMITAPTRPLTEAEAKQLPPSNQTNGSLSSTIDVKPFRNSVRLLKEKAAGTVRSPVFLWPMVGAVASVCVVLGLWLMIGGDSAQPIGYVFEGQKSSLLLRRQDGEWKGVSKDKFIQPGDRLKVSLEDSKPVIVHVSPENTPTAKITIHSNMTIQMERWSDSLRIYPASAGKVGLKQLKPGGSLKRIRFYVNEIWVEMQLEHSSEVNIQVHGNGSLSLDVLEGAIFYSNKDKSSAASVGQKLQINSDGTVEKSKIE